MVQILCLLRPRRAGQDPDTTLDRGHIVEILPNTHVFGAKEVPPVFTIVQVSLAIPRLRRYMRPKFEQREEAPGEFSDYQVRRRVWIIDRLLMPIPIRSDFNAGAVDLTENQLGNYMVNIDSGQTVNETGGFPP